MYSWVESNATFLFLVLVFVSRIFAKTTSSLLMRVQTGFRLLVAEALFARTNVLVSGRDWNHGSACGVLYDFNSSSENKKSKWFLHEKVRPFAKDDIDRFYFSFVDCSVNINSIFLQLAVSPTPFYRQIHLSV